MSEMIRRMSSTSVKKVNGADAKDPIAAAVKEMDNVPTNPNSIATGGGRSKGSVAVDDASSDGGDADAVPEWVRGFKRCRGDK